jgi:hypothetical protein
VPSDLQASFLSGVLACEAQTEQTLPFCFDALVQQLGDGRATPEFLGVLATLEAQDERVRRHCHPLAHAIGRWNFRQADRNVSDAFAACDRTCFSGCFHGSMEPLFFTDEELAAGLEDEHATVERMRTVVQTACQPSTMTHPSPEAILQCVHGAGHAILHGLDYRIPEALSVCDELDSAADRETCYSAVFMENITAAEPERRTFDRDDPHYPCRDLAPVYQSSCYYMQSSFLMEFGYTPEAIIDFCRTTPVLASCLEGYGREIASAVRYGEPAHTVRICFELARGEESTSCLWGAIKSLVSDRWDGRDAYALCEAIPDVAWRGECYLQTGRNLQWGYLWTPEQVLADCVRFSGSDQPGCALAAKPAR